MNALLALFIRSLREVLRSRMSYWMLCAMVGLIFLFLLGASASATAMTAPGLKFFESSLFIVLGFITLAGVSYFASAITEEKEEGTLGLLRMTDLDPLAILLGKGTSRLSGALLLLAATMPFTFLAVTLGGVSARQVVASYLCLGAYLILLANLALLVSVLSPRGAVASAVMAAVVLGSSALAALFKTATSWLTKMPYGHYVASAKPVFDTIAELIETVNPFRRLGRVLSTGFDGPIVDVQFWTSLALGGACLAVAWLLFDFATGEAAQTAFPRLVPRPGSRWQRFAPGRAWLVSALAWKDFYFLHGGRVGMRLKWIVYSGFAIYLGVLKVHRWNDLSAWGTSVTWTMTWFLTLEMCLAGSRIVRTELREQTLTGLAGLPLAMQHIVLMKIDGARRSLVPAFSWMCAGMAITALGAAFVASARGPANLVGTMLGWGYFASQAWLLTHLAAYFSLRLKWGALPVSLAVLFAANLVGAAFCIGLFVMPIVALTYVPQLRTTIYQRLEELAAED